MNKIHLNLELEPFHRFGRRFFNARAIYVNSLGEHYVVNVGEYPEDCLVKVIHADAAIKQELYFDAITNHLERKS